MSNELFMGGTRLYERDQAELAQIAANTQLARQRTINEAADLQLNPLRGKLLEGQIAHQGTMAELNRAQVGHQGALSELNKAQASAILAKMGQEEKVAATIAASLGGGRKRAPALEFDEEGNPVAPAEEPSGISDLADLGQKVMAAGDLKKGEDLIKLAAELKHKEAQTSAANASELVRRTNARIKKIEFMREVMSGVTDKASHARAMLLLQGNSLTSGEGEVPEELRTYDPALIKQFLAGSETALKLQRNSILAFNAASADGARNAAQETRDYLAGLTKRRTDAYVERAAAIAKTGDEKSVPAPNSAEIKLLKRELEEEGIEFDDEEDPAAVAELAEQAKILTTRNPSLSHKAAVTKVAGEAVKRGDLVRGKKRWYAPNKKSTYTQTEGTVAMPLSLPASRADLVVGNYYRGPDGRIEQWTGSGGEPVSKPVPKPGK